MSNLQQLNNNNERDLFLLNLENKIARFLHLKNSVKEYEQLKKELKGFFEGVSDISTENYMVSGKWIEKKEFVMPAVKYWDMRIKEIK